MPKMKYRLAIKMGPVTGSEGKRTSEAYVSWAVVRLGNPKFTGQGNLPYAEMDGGGEVRVIDYSDPQDMVEPMTLDAYEKRLQAVIGTLPEDSLVIRVPFNKTAYTKWLGQSDDSHTNRATWANQLTL